MQQVGLFARAASQGIHEHAMRSGLSVLWVNMLTNEHLATGNDTLHDVALMYQNKKNYLKKHEE